MNFKWIFFTLFITQSIFGQKTNPKNIENWINQNFSNSRVPFNNGKYMFVAFSTVSNGVLRQRRTSRYFDPKFSFMNENQMMNLNLNLKDLYYDSVFYKIQGDQYYIYAKCVGNVICSRSINDKGEKNGSEIPLLGMIKVSEANISKCTEAFSKLIKYYGGKKQYDW